MLDASLSEQERFSAVSRSVAVDAVSFDPATDTLVTGIAERTGTLAFDETVNVWNDALDAPKYTLGGESEDVAGCSAFNARIDFDPNGSAMATASHDFSVAIVDLATGVVDHELPTESGTVLDLAYTPDGRYLVATTEGSMTRVWNTQDFSVAADVATPMGGYHAVAMMPDGVTMAAVELTGSVSLVDILSGEIRSSFAEPAERTASLAVSDDGALVAAPGLDATVSIWSTQSGQRVADLDGATGTVVDLRFVGASKIVAASDDGTVRTWTVDATA